jgi:dihydropyrimidinase
MRAPAEHFADSGQSRRPPVGVIGRIVDYDSSIMRGEGHVTNTFDVLIQGGLVVTGRGISRSDVGIFGERIADVGEGLPAQCAQRILDATGKIVLPGTIDVHTHPVYLDDIHDTSLSAAFGGTTTTIHYAYARPGMRVLDTIRMFRDDGLQNSLIDFGLHAGLFDIESQLGELPEAFQLGVTSFKVFMTYAKLKWMTDDYWLMAVLDVVGGEGGMVAVHAESGLATDYLEDKYTRMQLPALEVFTRTRPDLLEAEAVNRAIAMASVADCALYIPHVSTPRALAPIRCAREEGRVVYSETCPQYLTLTEAMLLERGPQAKIGPPLRAPEDNEGLWHGIRDGTIDTIASDHAPKAKEAHDDFSQAAYGSPQVETLLTVTHDAGVNTGRVSFPRLVQLLSETPAKIFGYYPKKGIIAPGSDADLVLFDPTARLTIDHANQHSNANYTLYEGRECLGRPVWVMQRGRVLIEDGELVGTTGEARYLPTEVAVGGL